MREQFGHPTDFIRVFGHMGLHPDAGVTGRQLTCATQLRFARCGCKARRDRVAQAVCAMPTRDQLLGFIQALLRAGVAQTLRAVAVLQHPPTDHAQLTTLGFFKQGVHRGRVGGGKSQRCGDAVAHQFIEIKPRHFTGVRGVGETRFLRKGVVVQPGQQAIRG